MRYMLMVAVVVAFMFATPVSAIPFHHCQYNPSAVDERIHEKHGSLKCGNTDAVGDYGYSGECEASNSYFWTFMDCSGGTCTITGTLGCPGGTKSYQITCTNNGNYSAVEAESDRYSAYCDDGIGGSLLCDCSSPGYFCSGN